MTGSELSGGQGLAPLFLYLLGLFARHDIGSRDRPLSRGPPAACARHGAARARRTDPRSAAVTAELLIVVDTEEEFDWAQPFSREATATRSIPAQARAHEIFDRFGVVPTYVVDYPVATDQAAMRF